MACTQLMLAKVITSTVKRICTVSVPRLEFDTHLKAHFRHRTEYEVVDEGETCKPGDWVLIEQLPERLSLTVNHRVKRSVWHTGNIIDPVTGKRCLFTDFTDDLDREAVMFGGKAFDEFRRETESRLDQRQQRDAKEQARLEEIRRNEDKLSAYQGLFTTTTTSSSTEER